MRYLGTVDLPLAGLAQFPGNARRGDLDVIRASVRRHGQYRSIVVRRLDDGSHVIVAGNHTALALTSEGHDQVRADLIECDDGEARRINLADNRTAELGGYDDEALAALLGELGGDFGGTGWSEADLAALIGPGEPEARTDPDDVPEPPAEPVTRPGDVWLLGPHRLLCGDATSPDDLARVTQGLGAVGIAYTDPPYGISIVSSAGTIGGPNLAPMGNYRPVAGDDTTDVAVDAFRLLFAEYTSALHVWWGGNHYAAAAGLPDSSCWLVWDKQNGDNNFADAELAWTNHTGAVRILQHMWAGMLRASEHAKRVHPNQKPVALAEWAFGVIDPKAERGVVLDAFAGSGSTLIAAHRTQRTAALIELEPAYCDVICRRYAEHTGTKPVLEATGEPHDFTA